LLGGVRKKDFEDAQGWGSGNVTRKRRKGGGLKKKAQRKEEGSGREIRKV